MNPLAWLLVILLLVSGVAYLQNGTPNTIYLDAQFWECTKELKIEVKATGDVAGHAHIPPAAPVVYCQQYTKRTQ